ncbi:uncharacterized protein LOC142174347 [Nicotiana tabacum]|uniref:Uncharacterized protein LOC142174347 n=1 Tax=Nicotiana tabacum TaxID=4097 RepID=A0AC58TG72_TOBAC
MYAISGEDYKQNKVLDIKTPIIQWQTTTGSYSPSKRALIFWDRIYMPVSAGGLNVINFEWWNKTALCKLVWAVHSKKDALWIKWIHSVYIKKNDFNIMQTPNQACWLVRKVFDIRDWYKNIESFANINKFCRRGQFSIQKMYTLSRPRYPKVGWKALLLGTSVPRHNFILWLALNRRFTTMDRLVAWGIQVDLGCVLCKNGKNETMTHLYFEC